MSAMEHRLQLRLDDERYAAVEAEARRSGRSVAAVIREAIDYRYLPDAARRRQAGRRLLAVSTGRQEREPDWEDAMIACDRELEQHLES
ncbi:MAG: CopG family transcriptional regulator [Actinomycetes bacterium]